MATGTNNIDQLKEEEINRKLAALKNAGSSTQTANSMPAQSSNDLASSFANINPNQQKKQALSAVPKTQDINQSSTTNSNEAELMKYLNLGISPTATPQMETPTSSPEVQISEEIPPQNVPGSSENPQLDTEGTVLQEQTPDPNTLQELDQVYELDDSEEEANFFGEPEEIQNEDQEGAAQAITELSSIEQFGTPEQSQAAMNLYAHSPSVQQFFRTSPQDLVMQTGMGKELERTAATYNIVPDSDQSIRTRTQFQQGDGIYVDPVSGKPVSRPGFFRRLANAIKYAIGIGDMYETQPMQGMGTSQTINTNQIAQPSIERQGIPLERMAQSNPNFAGNMSMMGQDLNSVYAPLNNQLNYQNQMSVAPRMQNPQMFPGQEINYPQMQGQMNPGISPLLRGSQTGQNNFYFDIPSSPEQIQVPNPYDYTYPAL